MTQKCFLVTVQDIKELLLLCQVMKKVTTQTQGWTLRRGSFDQLLPLPFLKVSSEARTRGLVCASTIP